MKIVGMSDFDFYVKIFVQEGQIKDILKSGELFLSWISFEVVNGKRHYTYHRLLLKPRYYYNAINHE